MDFGNILDEWEKETAKPRGKSKNNPEMQSSAEDTQPLPQAHPLDVWMRRYGVTDKDAESEENEEAPHERRRRLRSIKSEAEIDLHGLTQDDAWIRLESFFADCVRSNLQKVLIIHGKGTHSPEDPVLRKMVQHFLEKHPHAGESGFSTKTEGGTGSTWVILK
ncbi:MAG TPA: Smr/MutS family protein [Treponema sp.]|nr:Smr/MutS family protein [Treponema sp.]